ncbi:UNVERIFIED_CONTAM: hypothetical protein Slati_3683100 [Sesamum latifolium]|uniref:Uncharacterized protein n=1 Tax=Sesamum latifolium TaxID=2727402 RepID=A0AAW2U1E7_9LAMI
MRELEHCKLGLINWSRKEFGDVSNKISKLEKEITGRIIPTSFSKRDQMEATGKAAWLAEGD